MEKAAQLTLGNGYDCFRFYQPNISQGSEYAGTYSNSYGYGYATGYGNSAQFSGQSTTFSTPMYKLTSDVGVTVVMYHFGEPGAQGAFDARTVLKKYSH